MSADGIPDVAGQRPEYGALLHAIRAHFGQPNELGRLLVGADADVLVGEASEHGLIPLVHRQVERMPAAPERVRHLVRAEAQRIVASNLALGQELAALMTQAADAGLSPLAFKGPTQALQAYGDLGFRPFSDLDVLVRAEDLAPMLGVLRARGYHTPSLGEDGEYPRGGEHHVGCHHPTSGILVEVHRHPVSSRFPIQTDEEEYWERAGTVAVAGTPIPTLGLEDALLITCAHAAKHYFERLEWAVSIAAFATRVSGLDGARALQLAEEGGIRRVLLTGLALAQDVAGVTLGGALAEAVAADRRARSLSRRALRSILRNDQGNTYRPLHALEPIEAVRFHLLVRDRLGDGLRFLLAQGDADRLAHPVGPRPSAAQSAARLFRLLRRSLSVRSS